MPSVCETERFNLFAEEKEPVEQTEICEAEISVCSALPCLSGHVTADLSLISILKELMKVLRRAC